LIRLYRYPFSTNVERVALALAHKGLAVESVEIDPKDRSEVRRVSGQDLVPVIEDDGRIVYDSMEIVRYLEESYPESPLYPNHGARRAEVFVFVDWFNRVWKRPPNEIVAEMEKPAPDAARIDRLGRAMPEALDIFEAMLIGREHLMSHEFSAVDLAVFPFVKYALLSDPADTEPFHKVLVRYQPLGGAHPLVKDWIQRVDQRPRV